MLVQEEMIQRVKALCRRDPRLLAAMMYGSFTKGSGDQYSDIEFVLFFDEQALKDLDRVSWVSQIAPVDILYTNQYGVSVAIFHNLVRGEFHFYPISDVRIVATWTDTDHYPTLESTLVVDKTGELTPYLTQLVGLPDTARLPKEKVLFFVNSFFNWLILGLNLLKRGDDAHAHNILWMVQRPLLALARVAEGSLKNLLSPTKDLEEDLSPQAVERYRACTSDLDRARLSLAYAAALEWGLALIQRLEAQYGPLKPQGFASKLAAFASDL